MSESSVLTCRVCADQFVFPESRLLFECPSCGTPHSRPRSMGDRLADLRRAHEQRASCDFENAVDNYQAVLRSHPDEAEALWGLALCKYGVEYVRDDKTGKILPVIHFLNRRPFTEDPDFRLAIARADEALRPSYQHDAEYIARVQQEVLSAEMHGLEWDVFLCYKQSVPGSADPDARTREFIHAQELYIALRDAGMRVFFAHQSLRHVAGANYEAQIFHALQSAKAMLVITSNPQYLMTSWVHSEWQRYLERVDSDRNCRLIPLLYDGCSPNDLPDEFIRRSIQALDMRQVTALDNLRNRLRDCMPRQEKPVQQPPVPEKPRKRYGRLIALLLAVLLAITGVYVYDRYVREELLPEAGSSSANPVQADDGSAETAGNAWTEAPCEHARKTEKAGQPRYISKSDTAHTIETPYENVCADCGIMLNSFMRSRDEAHSLNSSGECTKCGYQCQHASTYKETGAVTYTSAGSNAHTVKTSYTEYCNTCGAMVDSGSSSWNGSHSLNSSGKCTECNYQCQHNLNSSGDCTKCSYQCPHASTYTVEKTATYTSAGSSTHMVKMPYTQYCNTCGAAVNSGINSWSEVHSLNSSGNCTQCGYQGAQFNTTLSSPTRKRLSGNITVPVYSGPGTGYYRGSNGLAECSLHHDFYLFGYADGWYMISYETSGGAARVGYVKGSSFSGSLNASTLRFANKSAKTSEAVSVTDDPDGHHVSIATLSTNTPVTYLATYGNWYYIECKANGKNVRGFIPVGTLKAN